jgi:hypothetical protein
MSLINRAIPNLYNGVSQQPASLRLPSQAEEQINGISSVVYGVYKRPPTRHVAKINNLTNSDSYIHTINRDVNNQYVVVITNGDLKVYNIDGVEQTVSFPNGKDYLNATTPRDAFSVVTVADYSFVVNKTTTVAKLATVSGGTFKGAKQRFVDLPTSGLVNDDVWEIAGDASNNFDNYYVKYVSSAGVWRETIKPALLTSLDPATMPYQLVNNGGGNFTFSQVTWNTRLIGDDVSAVFPSFVGKQIQDVFFHRNRLGFIADENVIFSRAGDFFNFFPETTTAVLDTDPVDVAVSHTKVAILKHALSFNTSLMLFADQAQFQLTARDVLTPKTTAINVTTEFNIDSNAKPASASTSIFFATPKGNFSSIKEYAVQPLTFTNDASDITAHVPEYIPKNLFKLASSNLEDILIGLTLDERDAVYVYKYYWASPDEKVQSAWSKFKLDSGATILNADFIDTDLYMVVGRSDGMYLEVLKLQSGSDTDLQFLANLDQRITVTGIYNAGTNTTTWTTPYPVTGGTFKAVLGGSFTGQAGTELNLTVASANTLTATGDYSGGTVYLGRVYRFTYTFSPIIYKNEQKVSVPHYTMKLKNFKILYDQSGYFDVTVTPRNRDSFNYTFRDNSSYTFTGKQLGSTTLKIGSISIASGDFKFPIFSDASTTVISVNSDSSLPVALQATEYEALLTSRSKHI